MANVEKIKVLIVDDSSLVRTILTEILSKDPQIEVVGTAMDPFIAREKIKKLDPDVITLDVEMPKMDGLSFLKNIMRLRPMPVIMISTLTEKNAEITLKALELGAIDYVNKPKLDVAEDLVKYSDEIISKVKVASRANIKKTLKPRPIEDPYIVEEKFTATSVIKRKITTHKKGSGNIIAIGASTGGTEAIKEILVNLPVDVPGILVAQHIPKAFSTAFSSRLDSLCKIKVMEASEGQIIEKGCAYIAPGDQHLLVEKDHDKYICRLNDGPAVNRHKPSVDVLFRSVEQTFGNSAIGVILTGMGADGAKGLLEMRESGAITIAQDEFTSVVWGMPGEAVNLNAADYILPLDKIAGYIMAKVSKNMVKH